MASLPDAVPVDKLESLLSCPICLEMLNEPRTLPCFHSFCKDCLGKFVQNQRKKAAANGKHIEDFNCPTCRMVFTLKPNEEVEAMSGSHFIRNMIEVMAIQRQTKVAKCSQCGQPSSCRCVDCQMFMCKACLGFHEKWSAFKKHSVLSMDELSQPENQTKIKARLHCTEHGAKKLKFYCETCKELVCRYCMDFNHVRPDHLCSPIEKVAEKHREAMKSCFENLQVKLLQGNLALEATKNASQALKDNAAKAKEQISQRKEEIRKVFLQNLEEQTQIGISEVDKSYKETLEKLTTQTYELESFIGKVKESVNLSKNLLEKGNDEEIIASQKMMKERVENVKRECPENMKPVHDGKIQYETTPIDVVKLTEFVGSLGGKVVCQDAVNLQLYSILKDTSIILRGKDDHVNQMVEWLEEHEFKWRLCYRASRDGWHAMDFHSKCNDIGPTVTLVQVNDYIFGGYTDQSWTGGGIYKRSTASFLFSLRNKDALPPFKVLVEDAKHAVCCNQAWGPIFGNGHDLSILSGNLADRRSFSKFGKSYKLPERGYRYSTVEGDSLLAGSQIFTPTEIEVFY